MEIKKVKTCEEYVLDELYSAQKEVGELKTQNQDLKEKLELVEKNHNYILGLIKTAIVGKVDTDSVGITSVYFQDSYMGSFYEGKENVESLKALAELIDLVNRLPVREGE